MSTLQKNLLTTMLGKYAGTKLYNWLNPCCDEFCKDVNACVRPYNSYIADLYQSTTNYTSGTLIVGKEYVIFTVLGSDDFTNVGFLLTGSPFIATGTTPTVWAGNTIVYDTVASTPVATTLLNNTGITFNYAYISPGVYSVTASSSLFSGCGMGCPPGQTTQVEISNVINIAYSGFVISVFPVSDNTMIILASDTIGTVQDNIIGHLVQNPIQITIYS